MKMSFHRLNFKSMESYLFYDKKNPQFQTVLYVRKKLRKSNCLTNIHCGWYRMGLTQVSFAVLCVPFPDFLHNWRCAIQISFSQELQSQCQDESAPDSLQRKQHRDLKQCYSKCVTCISVCTPAIVCHCPAFPEKKETRAALQLTGGSCAWHIETNSNFCSIKADNLNKGSESKRYTLIVFRVRSKKTLVAFSHKLTH